MARNRRRDESVLLSRVALRRIGALVQALARRKEKGRRVTGASSALEKRMSLNQSFRCGKDFAIWGYRLPRWPFAFLESRENQGRFCPDICPGSLKSGF